MPPAHHGAEETYFLLAGSRCASRLGSVPVAPPGSTSWLGRDEHQDTDRNKEAQPLVTEMTQMGDEIEPKVEQPPEVEPPREGTLAWLQTQRHVDVLGLQLPHCHRVPEGATLAEANGHCRVIRPVRGRCTAPATRLYGLCIVHLGGGGTSLEEMRAKAVASKARLKIQREILGVGPNRVGSARQRARVQAAARAEQVAEALLAPLDDEALSSMLKQAAAVKILDATEPLQSSTIELELPAEEGQIQALGWEQMQALAARLLADPEP